MNKIKRVSGQCGYCGANCSCRGCTPKEIKTLVALLRIWHEIVLNFVVHEDLKKHLQ